MCYNNYKNRSDNMFLKKKKTEEDNIMNDKDFKEMIKKAKFVFS